MFFKKKKKIIELENRLTKLEDLVKTYIMEMANPIPSHPSRLNYRIRLAEEVGLEKYIQFFRAKK